jgi:D-sedoheptulose 7-phosphate isomerase
MSDFLYPFLDDVEPDLPALLDDLSGSADAKVAISEALQTTTLEGERDQIDAAAAAMAARFRDGGRLFTFGNGGSSTDAASVAALFASPPWAEPLPARCLAADTAILTALGNDVGFELVFSRQLIAHARAGDIGLGLSTSGNSRSLITAFREARARDVLTVGLAGYDGGDMGRSEDISHCLVARSDSIHRIQETHGALSFALWSAVHEHLADVGAARG